MKKIKRVRRSMRENELNNENQPKKLKSKSIENELKLELKIQKEKIGERFCLPEKQREPQVRSKNSES